MISNKIIGMIIMKKNRILSIIACICLVNIFLVGIQTTKAEFIKKEDTSQLPDLIIGKNISLKAIQEGPFQYVYGIHIEVKNIGEGDVTNWNLKYCITYLDSPEVRIFEYEHEEPITIKAGETKYISTKNTGISTKNCDREIVITIDPDNEIEESNELNNNEGYFLDRSKSKFLLFNSFIKNIISRFRIFQRFF